MKTTAAVLAAQDKAFELKEVTIAEPAPDEVLIDIAGVGLCHTDLAVRDGHLPFPLPGVLGHEGSGVVIAVGSNVTKVVVGDRVAASFNSCGECAQCQTQHPAYCVEFAERNFSGSRPEGTTALAQDGDQLGGNFFGQSSFAHHAMARERNVVKIPESVPIELAGPLGCGVQTGAGAVMNSLNVQEGASLLVTGGGSVGLSGVLGAVARGAQTIIVSDPIARRRELALELGATHALNPLDRPLSEQVREILPAGVEYALDTTAIKTVFEEIIAVMAQRGHLGMVGVPANPEAELTVNLLQKQSRGLTFSGIVEGDSDPEIFIPSLIELYEKGEFPFDKLITVMPFEHINQAIEAQASGQAVKVVLVP